MPEKKPSPKTKADIEKNKGTEKKSSVIKKELTPLTSKETKKPEKSEKKSVTLLKEAINTAKNKALDNEVVAKPVKKRATSVKKVEEKLEKPEKSKPIKKDALKETKTTYTKADIAKPAEVTKPADDSMSVVFEKKEIKAVDLLKANRIPETKSVDIKISDEDNITPSTNESTTYTKESILSVLTRKDSSESKEDLLKESIKNLQDKIKIKQEEETEIKKNIEARNTIDHFAEKETPSTPEVNNIKATKPESTPSYSYKQYMQPEKKESKKPFILILGIVLVIAGVSFGVFKFVLNKENTDVAVNTYVELEETVESTTNDAVADLIDIDDSTNKNINTPATEAPTEQTEAIATETPEPDEVIEKEIPKEEVVVIEKEVKVVETPPTPVAPTPPVTPPTPTAPKVEPPLAKKLTKPYIIAWKDTLQAISEDELGDIRRWPTIYNLNKNILKSPDSYRFGTTLAIPIDKTSIENMSAEDKASLYNDYLVTIEAYKKINNAGMVIILERTAKTLK